MEAAPAPGKIAKSTSGSLNTAFSENILKSQAIETIAPNPMAYPLTAATVIHVLFCLISRIVRSSSLKKSVAACPSSPVTVSRSKPAEKDFSPSPVKIIALIFGSLAIADTFSLNDSSISLVTEFSLSGLDIFTIPIESSMVTMISPFTCSHPEIAITGLSHSDKTFVITYHMRYICLSL